MLTGYCATCHTPKTNYADTECTGCLEHRASLMKDFADQFPNASESDKLYAVRSAMQSRQGHARSDYVDPRGFNAHVRMQPPLDPSKG